MYISFRCAFLLNTGIGVLPDKEMFYRENVINFTLLIISNCSPMKPRIVTYKKAFQTATNIWLLFYKTLDP